MKDELRWLFILTLPYSFIIIVAIIGFILASSERSL
jgi:hypothetical protein